jgi:hypothetical protein
MKKLLVLLPVFLLSGCLMDDPAIVKMTWPDVPKEIMVACPDLQTVDQSNAQLSDVLDVVTDNYSKYQECQVKVDSWINWYTSQKKIYESVK